MLPVHLEEPAFRMPNGEVAWRRRDVPRVVASLRYQGLAVLGGEVWWIPQGASSWTGSIPQNEGPDAVYSWETKRQRGEEWTSFVNRCAGETSAAVEELPRSGEVSPNLPGRILYNLTWVGEAEYEALSTEGA